ncbi:HAMP domain-containing protein [Seongchinamella sediminis]|uniref:histidine kinase n=1 Tax=Seongchinamella sediminis TaxID=2283635 RepID=A0A3L7E4F3_9GAMM|nr:ATP-binding protein [Seongchinamella sediminis]RLQ23453.1 HAMP domain-containing protein [Seongchinamella sediminis]
MRLSLQQRLTWILLSLTLFAWIGSAVVTYVYANRVLLGQVDRQLGQYADLVNYITRVFERQLAEGQPLYEAWSGHDYDQAHLQPIVIETPVSTGLAPAINVWEQQNRIAVLAGSPLFERPTREGLSNRELAGGGGQWRLLSMRDESTGLWVQVGIELGAARQDMIATLGRAFLPLLIVVPLTIAVLYLGVARGLRPLKNLASQISSRKPGLLDPVATADVPSELDSVVSALNSLLARLAAAMESEQRFTANAAHELLTPLAAIKTEVQLCQRQLGEEPAAAMLTRITQRVDRAAHTVEQLLTLARLDPEAPLDRAPLELRALLTEALADTAHLAADKQLTVALEEGPAIQLEGNAEALAIMLRNLLVNAFKYSGGRDEVSIALRQQGPEIVLEVCNDCEPLSAAEHAQLGRRFYRVPGSAGQGAGLGLSIVARIALLHGARVATGPGEGGRGFCARVNFPQPA